ncbi:MAG: GNAT family N-acetyltransferase [Candidatus Limnocylindrales bacterium]|jgi:hypothetical protein
MRADAGRRGPSGRFVSAIAHLDARFGIRVDYLVRQARITDVDRLYALCVEMGSAPGAGTPLDAIGLLRQLVYMPNASVVVAEAGRQIAGGAVLGLRPSVRAGGFVGTVDVLVVAPGHSAEKVTDGLIEEIMTSARRKGCTTVEIAVSDDATLRACLIRHGFAPDAANIYRAEVPVRAPVTR